MTSPSILSASRPSPAVTTSSLFVHAPEPGLVVDGVGRIRGVNAEGVRLLARPLELLVDTPVGRWVHRDDAEAFAGALRQAAAGRPAEARARLRTARGRVVAGEIRVFPPDGADGGMVVLFRVADARAAGEEGPLLDFLEGLPRHFLVTLDQEGRIGRSRGLDDTHLMDARAVRGLPYDELARSDEASRAQVAEMLAALRGGKTWRGLQWHRRDDGQDMLVRIAAAPRYQPGSGSLAGAWVSGLDIDASRRESDRAQSNEVLASLGAAAAETATRLERGAHDVADALRALRDAGTPGLDEALRQAATLATLAAPLAELAEEPEVPAEAVDLVRLAQDVVGSRPPVGVDVTVLPVGDVEPVPGSARTVERVLGLLLDNAEENARSRVRVRIENRPGVVAVGVEDDGPAMTPETRRRAVEPFFTTRAGRTGMGLTLARGLLLLNRGRLWIPAAGDEGGSAVWFELPLASGETSTPVSAGSVAERGRRLVMVVDDDRAVSRSVSRFLEKAGYHVVEAWSGRAAMARITGGRLPDMVITDLKMLDGSGSWLLEQMEAYFPELVRRTLVITGETAQERAAEVVRRTGCPVLRKPFELHALLDLVDRKLELA